MTKDPLKRLLEHCFKQSTQVIFLSKSDITIDIREVLQQFTTVYPDGLTEFYCQAQMQERSPLIFLSHSFITSMGIASKQTPINSVLKPPSLTQNLREHYPTQ